MGGETGRLGLGLGDWDWEIGIEIGGLGLGDWDWGMGVGIGRLGLGDGDWDWETGIDINMLLLLLLSPSVMSYSATPWTVAHQAPLSMEFSGQDY